MRINRKYLIRCSETTRKEPEVAINSMLQDISQSIEEGVNFAMEVTPAGGPYTSIEISCVVLHPDVFRKMVEKIDYHDPYYMDLILPDLSTIEQ